MKKNHKILFILFLLFFAIRIGAILLASQKDFKGYDSQNYDGFAHAILERSDWITNPNFLGHKRPPAYPMFIAAVYAIFGVGNYLALYIFQAILSTFTCLYIYKLSKEIFEEKVALLSFIWSGFYIFYLFYVGWLLRETLVFFLMIVLFFYLYLYLARKEQRSRNFWLFAIFYTLLIHADARYLFYLPFFILLFLTYQPVKQALKMYSAFLTVTVLFMIPWTARNYIAYDGFVLINTRTLDLRPKSQNDATFFNRMKYNVLNFQNTKEVRAKKYPSEKERELVKQGFNPNRRSAEEVEAIKKDIYPASSFLKRKLYWLIELWRPVRFSLDYSPYPDIGFQKKWSLKHNLTSFLCYGLLLPFIILGVYFLLIQKNKLGIFLCFPLLIQTLLHILQWGRTRYRIPIDSFIIILALFGFWQLFDYIKKRTKASSP